ncbi:MAG: DsrE family protein [Chlorobium phaeobacteroides]|uniref:DsrE family protein n=1 Tax=Chlorobium phaeobacteroides (strain BS1) TaxID=331678 RepID=B3ELG0_CHLPB|nr:DsrE family protein [Chlorobium phaeobacteroides]MBL6956113.1 DsrE family protein [Chlorobium phaeobacteroides]
MEKEKLVIISTVGTENPEKATLPFVLATACQSLDADVVVFLQSSGVVLAKNGEAATVNAPGLAPLKDLLDTFMELGGTLYLCSPCLKERNISMNDVVEGAEVAAAGTLASEVMSAKSVVTY